MFVVIIIPQNLFLNKSADLKPFLRFRYSIEFNQRANKELTSWAEQSKTQDFKGVSNNFPHKTFKSNSIFYGLTSNQSKSGWSLTSDRWPVFLFDFFSLSSIGGHLHFKPLHLSDCCVLCCGWWIFQDKIIPQGGAAQFLRDGDGTLLTGVKYWLFVVMRELL